MSETRRQALRRTLAEGPATVLDLSRRLHVPVRSVLADLEHVARGLRAGERLDVREAECLQCGFRFRGRKRFTTPSRCPECRGELIRDPEYSIADGAGE